MGGASAIPSVPRLVLLSLRVQYVAFFNMRSHCAYLFCLLNTRLPYFQSGHLGCDPTCCTFLAHPWHGGLREPTVLASWVCLVALGGEDRQWVTWPPGRSELIRKAEKRGSGCHRVVGGPSPPPAPCCLMWIMDLFSFSWKVSCTPVVWGQILGFPFPLHCHSRIPPA